MKIVSVNQFFLGSLVFMEWFKDNADNYAKMQLDVKDFITTNLLMNASLFFI